MVLLSGAVTSLHAADLDLKTLALIPIQEGGRIKPLDTFARESVRYVSGFERFGGRSSLEVLLGWMTHPEEWEAKELILVRNLELRELLKIPKDQKRVAAHFLLHHEGFLSYARACHEKQEKEETLSTMEKEALAVFGRLHRFQDVLSGDGLTFIPLADRETGKWASLGELQDAFRKDPSMPEAGKAVLMAFARTLRAYDAKDASAFKLETLQLDSVLTQLGSGMGIPRKRVEWEYRYNILKPFQWAWILHLLAAFLAAAAYFLSEKAGGKAYGAARVFFAWGVGISLLGFTLRCLVSGRPPVSNMYESVIWVTFGMSVLTLVFERIYRNRAILLSGTILAWIGYVLADNVPAVLDPAIQPIEPVLRSNFWLTIHVLTITSSYAAFILATGLAHIGLWFAWKGGGGDRARALHQLIYRAMQVGVVLLAAGTILGGVWANYSWGRFWGWDPKETWALIALLGYVAVLHGRLAGWIKGTGFPIAAILAFIPVLMAWYGVNFILGVGLHSYGFSEGGQGWVGAFVLLEIVLVVVVGLKGKFGRSGQ